MHNSLVTIIVPCYNQAQYLDDCLASVHQQTYHNWECLIIDDGSPDDTKEVATAWTKKDTRFRYIHQQNSGVSAARNLGLKEANGVYIQFLDGDDILQQKKIESQVAVLSNNNAVDIVYTGSRYFFHGKPNDLFAIHPLGIIPTIETHYTDENQLDVLFLKNICTICAGLYRRSLFDQVHFKETVYEDFLLHLELSANGYRFHYHQEDNTNCLIRLTEDSQMIRHIHSKDNTLFRQTVEDIKAKNPSKLVKKTVQTPIKVPAKNTLFKDVVYNITPPLIIKLIKKLFHEKN